MLVSAELLRGQESVINLSKHLVKPAWAVWGVADAGIGKDERDGWKPLSIGKPQRSVDATCCLACISTLGTKLVCPNLLGGMAGHVNKHSRGIAKIMILTNRARLSIKIWFCHYPQH